MAPRSSLEAKVGGSQPVSRVPGYAQSPGPSRRRTRAGPGSADPMVALEVHGEVLKVFRKQPGTNL